MKKDKGMNGFRITAIAYLITFPIAVSVAIPEIEQGWLFLYDNQYEEARGVFENYMHNPVPPEEARLGIMLCDLAQGDAPSLTESLGDLIQQHPDSPYLAAYLSLMEINDLQGWHPAEQLEIVRQAWEHASHPLHQHELQNRIATLQSVLLSDEAYASAKKAGVLLDHWSVAGTFGEFGSPDYFQPFGPELGIQARYSGWRQEVSFQSLTPMHQNGWLVLDGLFYPRAGMAYTVNVVEAKDSGSVRLIIESDTDFRAWWDGEPVLEKTTLKHQYQNALSRVVELRTGKNPLVIKTTANGRWNLRVRIQPVGTREIVWNSVPFDPAEFESLYLKPFETVEMDARVSEGYPFVGLEPGDEEAGVTSVYENILRALWHGERHDFSPALDCLDAAQAHAPGFALLYTLRGEINLTLGSTRSASKPRFQQAAESDFRRALEQDPISKKAIAGLLSYFLDRDQIDPALDLLTETLNEHPAFDEGYTGLLDYSKALLYARKGFEHESIRLMKQSAEPFFPSLQIPLRLVDFYMKYNRHDRAKAVLDEALSRFPGYLPYLNAAVRLVDAAETAVLESRLKQAIHAFPQNMEFALLLGGLYEKRGEWDQAKAVYEDALNRFPNHPQPLERLAEINTLINQKTDVETYRTVLDRNPLSRKALQVLRDAEGHEFPFQKYDVTMDDVDIKVAERWNNSRASSIYLIDMMVLVLHEDGTFDQYIHQALQILNQEGVRQWAEIVIPQGGNVEIIYGRTLNPDGAEWAVSNLQDLGGQQALSMYGIQPGSIIEYAYLQRSGNAEPGSNVYSGGYFFATDNDPMLLSKLTVLRHKKVPFHLDVHGEVPSTVTEEGDWIIYDWEKWLSDGIKPERFSPTLAKRVPSLQMTTGTDWMPFVERMRTTVFPFEEDSALIQQKALELTQGMESALEKTRRIYDWIRDNIEDSSGGQTTVDTITLLAGNRYQKIRLAHQMLQGVGIESQLAVALENDENDGFRPLPFPNYPSTSLLIVPEQPGIPVRIVIDFSSRFSPMNQVNPLLRKQMALVLSEKTPYFEPLMPELWEHGLLMKEAHLTLEGTDAAAIQGKYTYDYGYDEQIRQALTNPEVKDRLVDAQIANDMRGIQITASDILDLEDIHKPPVLTFQGKLPGVVTANNGVLQIKPVMMKAQATGLISEPTREFPIEFNGSPMHEPLLLHYDLSAFFKQGAKITLPKNRFILHEFGYYSLFYAWEGEVLKVRRSFLIPDQTIAPEDYPRFVEFCREIDRIEDETIRITLPPGAGSF